MNFIVGSLTSFENKDPSFNIVYMNKEKAIPVDFETYHASIPDANKNDKAEWKRIYNYRDYFNLQNLSPAEFLKASENILYNETAAINYVKFYRVGGPGSRGNVTCDYNCAKNWHCETSSGDVDEIMQCHDWNIIKWTDPKFLT